MKVIRQPLIVDRLLVSEINKDNQSIGLALVYLNEYNVVSTITQILREISFGEFRRSKTAVFAIFWDSKFLLESPRRFLLTL